MHERRTGPRAPFDGWVEIVTPLGRRRGQAADLASGGVGLRLDPPLPDPATPVTSEFALPGISLPVAIQGVVAWRDTSQGRLGLRFAQLDPSLAELLASFAAGRL